MCGKVLPSESGLSQHVKEVHEDSDTIENCELCDKTFRNKRHLRKHFNVVHMKLNAQSCDVCNKTFTSSVSLKTHITVMHQKLTKQKCNLCESELSNAKALKAHVKRAHVKQNELFLCEVCGKEFNEKKHRNKHLKLHNTEEIDLKHQK